jgi:predicted P-loop ATPase
MDRQLGTLSHHEIRSHVQLLHDLAHRASKSGVLVVASYGEDPDERNDKGKLGKSITPKVTHFRVGDIERMVACILKLSQDCHRNVYVPFSLMRPDLQRGQKGFENDVVAVLALVTDFDDADAKNWEGRLPVSANYVLETSPERFQAFIILDEAVDRIRGKVLAERLQGYTRCDYGTRDVSHVWRIPGCLNYPNAKKVHQYGRSRDPAVSRIEVPWAGDFTSVSTLTEALRGVDLLSSSKVKGMLWAKAESVELPAAKGSTVAAASPIDVGLVVHKLPDKLKARITGAESCGDRSKDQFYVIRALIECKYSDDVILGVIRAHPNGVGAKFATRSDADLLKEVQRVRLKPGAAQPVRVTTGDAGGGEGQDWRQDLQLTERGQPRATLANAVLPLRHDQAWAGVLGYSSFGLRLVLRRRPPYEHGTEPWVERDLNDFDILATTEWLQRAGVPVQSKIAEEALKRICGENSFHPVREYLSKLKWDGTARIDTWLQDHFGVEDTPVNRAMGSKWLIGGVARILSPGCKMDEALYLEGPQGIRKSSALKAISCGWYTDQLPEIGNKDAYIQLQGVWVVEVAEMAGFKRSAESTRKAFMSSGTDRFRLPHDRLSADHPRQCLFAVTVNVEGGYLGDATGGRRSWTVLCAATWQAGRKIDIEGLLAVRNQLWAEAQHRFKAGEPWHMHTPELEKAACAAAEERYDADIWSNLISDYIDNVVDEAEEKQTGRCEPPRVYQEHIMSEVLRLDVQHWNRAVQMRITGVLTSLGWVRKREPTASGDGKRRYHYEPSVWPPAPEIAT